MSTTGKIDPSTLGWVKTEIDESLKQARLALESFAENSSDTTQLRFCITHLHQVVGTLEMVELGGAAMLAKETEALAQAVFDEKLKPDEKVFDVLTHSILTLPDYLGRLQFGQPDMPLRLLPIINDLRVTQSLEPISESELFEPDLSVRPPKQESDEPKLSEEEYLALAKKLRPTFQSALLKWLRSPDDTEPLGVMADIVEQLQRKAPLGMLEQLFWVAGGLVEAVTTNALEVGGDIKKLFARLEQQLKRLIDGSEKSLFRTSSENLIKSILFHIGHIKSGGEKVTQLIRAFNLHSLFSEEPETGDSEVEDLPTPEVVQSVSSALGKEIEIAQDLLSIYFDPDEKDETSFNQLPDLLKKMSSTVEILGVSVIKSLVDELAEVCLAIKDKRIEDPESVSMPIARALLLLESSLKEISVPDGSWRKQLEEGVGSLRKLHSPDADIAPGVEGIEVSEAELTDTEFKQLLNAVSGEIRVNLAKIEEALETFAGNSDKKGLLAPISQFLSQIEGALQILGQDKAAGLAAITSDIVQQLHDGILAPNNSVLDGLAVSVGTMGAFVEGLGAGRQNLDTLIDAALNDMDTSVNDTGEAPKEVAEAAPRDTEQVPPVFEPAALIDILQKNMKEWLANNDNEALGGLQQNLAQMALLAQERGQQRVKKICEEMNNLLTIVRDDPDQLSDDIVDMLQASSKALAMLAGEKIGDIPVPRSSAKDDVSETVIIRKQAFEEPSPSIEVQPEPESFVEESESVLEPVAEPISDASEMDDDDFDVEIMQIFVEDAREVFGNIKKDLMEWENNHDNWDALTELRRAFHTLKGSGRMVGATEIAELGWDIENLLNKVREGKMVPSQAIVDLVGQARDVLPEMIAQLEGGPTPTVDIAGIREKVKALAEGELSAVGQDDTPSEEKPDKTEEPVSQNVTPKLDSTLLGIFTNEARGHLRTIKDEVKTCRNVAEPAPPSKNLMRAIHTLQGNARSLGIQLMAESCGEMERMFLHMEAEAIGLNSAHLDILSDIEINVSQLVDAMNSDDEAPRGLNERFTNIIGRIKQEAAQLPVTSDEDKEKIHIAPKSSDKPPVGDTKLKVPKKTKTPARSKKAPSAPDKMPAIAKEDNIIDPELLEIFLEEAADILDTIENGLREWRQDSSNQDALQTIKRALHTLKGGSRMAGAMIMGDLSHATENVFKQIEDNAVTPDAGIFDLLEELHDTLLMMADKLQNGQPMPDMSAIKEKLASVLSGKPAVSSSPDKPGSAPSTAEPAPQEKGDTGAELEADDFEDIAEPEKEAATVVEEESDTGLEALEHDADDTLADRRMELQLDTEVVTDKKDRRGQIKVQTGLLNELANYAGEVSIARSRMEQQIYGFRENLGELHRNVTRFRDQLRELEIQSESQILYRAETESELNPDFDPLELDRYSKLQQLSRSLSESLHDLSTIQMSLDTFVGEAETVLLQQARINTDLQEGLMRTRMVDFSTQAARLRHIVRTTSRELGKRVELNITGSEVGVDRNVLERMVVPFEHMVRNAIDHGLENENERKRSGKSPIGQITINTNQDGSEIVIRFSDDGTGLDIGSIRNKAIERELIPPDANLSDEELMQFILLPGFSTAAKLTQLSGRGVGMDVVHTEVKQLGGSMSVETTQGQGTSFIIRLPLTLSVNQALMVSVGEQVFAIPLSAITNIIEVSREKLDEIAEAKKPLLNYDDKVYPFMNLGSRLFIPSQQHNRRNAPVLLAKAGQREVAIQVDGLAGTKEVVVKSVGPQLSEVKGIAGATVFGDGSVVLILDVPGLWFTDEAMHLVRPVEIPKTEEVKLRPVVMVVDDSLTVRKITSRHLQKRGYDIMIAKDGVDAIEQLRDHVPDLMLVDIEMPRMDGYELTSRVRSTSTLKHIPIIMITSRAGTKHKKRAMDLGVNIYMSKPYHEDDLFTNIESLLKEQTVQ